MYNYMDLLRYCYYNKIEMKGTIGIIVKDAIFYKYIFIEDKILELHKYDKTKLHVIYKLISKEQSELYRLVIYYSLLVRSLLFIFYIFKLWRGCAFGIIY